MLQVEYKKGKKVCTVTAFRYYQYFSLLFLQAEGNGYQKRKELQCSFVLLFKIPPLHLY